MPHLEGKFEAADNVAYLSDFARCQRVNNFVLRGSLLEDQKTTEKKKFNARKVLNCFPAITSQKLIWSFSLLVMKALKNDDKSFFPVDG
jgi:hypothetical protein